MFAFPSYLSFPWSLPLPSLPSISLPANIQRRFLSYILKRSLGKFVKAGGLDAERIQAQISEGRVEIEGLEIDVDEINVLIPSSLPFQVTSGSLSRLNARLPFPNLWSAPLQITLDTLQLDLRLVAPQLQQGGAKESVRPPPSPGIDLASSVASVADEFLHDELDAYEEAELDRSIRQSLILSQNDPFSEEVPGAFPSAPPSSDEPLSADVESTTILAGLIERVLARLEFKVCNVRLRIAHEDPRHGGTFELRIAEIKYADESNDATSESKNQTVRVVTFTKVDLFLSPLPISTTPSSAEPRRRNTFARSASNSSTSSSSTASGEDTGEMMMSMAVADLRHSMMTSVASGASVYQSALTETVAEEDEDMVESYRKGAHENRNATPIPSASRPTLANQEAVLILSFGPEPIVLRTATTQPQSTAPVSQMNPVPNSDQLRLTTSSMPAIAVELTLGTIASLILPSQAATILSALQVVTRGGKAAASVAKEVAVSTSVCQPELNIKLRVKALFASVVYDLSTSSNADFALTVAHFWQKPSMTDLPVGHLKLRLDDLQLIYDSPGLTPDNAAAHQQHPSYRKQPTLRRSPASPSLSLTLADFSMFEFLASAPSTEVDSPPGGSFPVLIFDNNLTQQYAHNVAGQSGAIPQPVFPDFDGIDWRNSGLQRRGASAEKAWKVNQKGKGVLKGGLSAASESVLEPVISVRKEISDLAPAKITAQSIHIFLDLSLLERLLPMLRHISPAVKHPDSSSQVPSPIPARPAAPERRSESYVLDDLDARAAKARNSPNTEIAIIRCPMLRVSIRCPAPPNRRGTWGDGAHLRSGIVTLDLHGLNAKVAGSDELSRKRSVRDGEEGGSVVEWKKMIFFFSRVPASKSSAFLVIGPLAPDPGDTDPGVLLPSIRINSTPSPIAPDLKMSAVVCRVPSVQAKIRQSTIEGLQFFADDLTHWLDGAFGDGSRPKPRDELKMIGSRFFGSKASSSASSSAIEDEDDDKMSAATLRIFVTETHVTLHVPHSTLPSDEERVLALRASDVSATVESNIAGRQETVVVLSIMDAAFLDKTIASEKRVIMSRTTPFALAAQNHPIVNLRFSSLTDGITGTKETSIKIVLSSFTFFVTSDIAWVKDLAAFAKTPEGVFEDVVPSEVTKISMEVYDGSIHLTPPNLSGAAVIVLGVLELKTAIVSDADESIAELAVGNSGLLMVDDAATASAPPVGISSSLEAWKGLGYAQLVELNQVEAQVVRDLTGSSGIEVDVLGSKVKVTACADSLAYLGPFFADLAKIAPAEHIGDEVKSPVSLEESIDVFASIDDDAFNQIPDLISGADLIEDDLPTNLDYLDQNARHTENSAVKSGGETLRSWQTTEGDQNCRLNSEVNGETVKVLYHEPFELDEDYWDTLPPATRGFLDETKLGNIRIRVQDAAVVLLLFEGYDWQKTRRAIEDEIKTVRRRLEKIRQLLASGQTADESIEHTRSVLFNSVYIGLDQSREMDPAALLAAIDEELGDMGNDASSASSWQTDFPSGNPHQLASGHRPSKKTRLKGKRLTRSKKAQMEIDLQSIRLDYDIFAPDSSTASRAHVTVGSMEIFDHIKTSTWKKFLTEMKADSRGNVRETDADMVRVELVGVRPSLSSLEEEFRLRAKVLPLRLHVDQDALDFLKRFFSFTSPGPASIAEVKKTVAEPFLQHVEIFPIELKLDYKPKRVDFAALREGKVIELMNFFHFDGAEMTLRHITLSGISGYTRLSTTLQDLWTPDVKANQLADVISGVSPVRSMVNVGSGVADLILLPIEQYRKDGRVARGIQKGTNSFVRSTALEMMKLGAKLATGTQVILERAEGVLGGKLGDKEVVGEVPWQTAGEGEGSSDDEAEVVSRYANQPGGAREGVQAAYKSLSKNVNAAAQTILAVPMEVYERTGDNGPLKAVVRAVPIAVLKPMIGASEAVSKTLLGMRNSLDPQGRDELGDKYK